MDTDTSKIAVIGLGYVGLPLAVEFAKRYPVVGFDINAPRIQELRQGKDSSLEVESEELSASSMTFTDQRLPHDCVLSCDGFELYIDAVALNFLRGVEIDFREGPGGAASFVFNNVFAATGGSGTCSACGAAGGGCA